MDQHFNYGWGFMPDFHDLYRERGLPLSAERVDLPHPGKRMPLHYFGEADYQDLFSYEKCFAYKKDPSKRLFLELEGAMVKTRCYLNGVDLGERISSYFPTSFELTDAVKDGENRLLLVVDSREDPLIPPFGGSVDYLTFAGIYRPVHLLERPKTFIKDLYVSGSMEGFLKVQWELEGDPSDAHLRFEVFDGDRSLISFEGKDALLKGITPWELDAPKLYLFKASLYKGETLLETKEVPFGFRSIRFDKKKGFFLNEKHRKLIGLNRHQNFPYVGAAMPSSVQGIDADLLKREAGINLVRTSHYPQSEAFLSRCDAIGLLVIDEVPGWQHIGKEEEWRSNFLSMIERMVRKERNHPCLIGYGTRVDESPDDHELYSQAVAIAKKLDPYRPTLGVRNFKSSECLEDIYAYNDFSCHSQEHGLDKPSSIHGAKGKPILISEFMGHMYPTKSTDSVDRRLEHVLRHLRVLDDAFKYDRYLGAIGWCAFDYNTHANFGSGDHVCYHGVYDIQREPKDAMYAYRSQGEGIAPFFWVCGDPSMPGDIDESRKPPLLVLGNCDYVTLYRNGSFVQAFYPDKKDFSHLPHPPIWVDDWIGASFEEPYSPKTKKKLRQFLNHIAAEGVAHVGPKDYLHYGPLLLRTGLANVEKLTALFTKYMTSWGSEGVTYTIKGYKDGREIGSKTYGQSAEKALWVDPFGDTLLNGETYDATMVRLRVVDGYGTKLRYADALCHVETKGPIALLGPADFPLRGGSATLYLRSLPVSEPSLAEVTITTMGLSRTLAFRIL